MRLLTLVMALASIAGRSEAQSQRATTSPLAVLTGVAIDSLDGGYLAGASVYVSGTALSATTDSTGQFKISGIPAGMHVVEIRHPLLDSLAVVITTTPKSFSNGDSAFFLVGIPSPETLVRSTCSEEDRAKGPAFVVGTVMDAETGKPALGASVTIAWKDYDIGKRSIRITPQQRVVPVSSSGRFRVCGLPDDLVAAVIASRGADSTAALQTNLSALVGILSFRLPPPRETAVSRDTSVLHTTYGTASVSGVVLDAVGKPSKGATVTLDADGATATSAEDGSFTLNGLRPGTRSLAVRKLGYEPARSAVELRRDNVAKVQLNLGRSITLLNDMVVNANRGVGLQRVGFNDRKKWQRGTFLGPEQLRYSDLHRIESVLLTVPVLKRAGCVKFFVDGFAVPPGIDPQDFIGGSEIGAVEAYSELFVPGEFPAITPITNQPCKAVVVWTKSRLGIR